MNEESELEELTPWLAIIITLIGGWLRVLHLGAKGMWLDETFSVWLASHSLPEMLQWIMRIDQHPQMKLTRQRDFYGGQVQYYVNP